MVSDGHAQPEVRPFYDSKRGTYISTNFLLATLLGSFEVNGLRFLVWKLLAVMGGNATRL